MNVQISKQNNNPFGSGFFQDPDQTDYFPLLYAIDTNVKRGGKRKRKVRNSLKQKKRRQTISRKRARA